jgi:hypothetical protein
MTLNIGLAAEMRCLNVAAEKRLEQEAEERLVLAKQKAVEERELATVWALSQLKTLERELRAKAEKGAKYMLFPIATFESERSHTTDLRVNALTILLEAEGFEVLAEYDREEPCGSDSMFHHTVHSTSVRISW